MAVRLPVELKSLQPYLKTAQEFVMRDPIVTYFCWLYAVQEGIRMGANKTPEGKTFLIKLMDKLEELKKMLTAKKEEAVTDDGVAHTYLEEKGDQLFSYADTEDRAERFGKNVVKAFYTSNILFTVLNQFGELSEETAKKQKYAKWKATYIHNCLKAGETPVPGPIGGDEEFDDLPPTSASTQPSISSQPPPVGFQNFMPPVQTNQPNVYPQEPRHYPAGPSPGAFTYAPTSLPSASVSAAAPTPAAAASSGATAAGGWLPYDSERHHRVEKLCKFVVSSLNYEDVQAAVDNLRMALNLLTTGKEEP